MKNIILAFIFACCVYPASAQKIIQKRLPYTSDKIVNLNLKFGDSIRVRYWDKPEVSVRIAYSINQGKLDDALLVTDKNTGDEIGLSIDFDKEKIREGKEEDCPKQKSSWNSDDGKNRYHICSEINYQVFLPRQAKLKLETINGNIDIEGGSSNIFAKTISGYVDMSWPKAKGASVAMKTITGEVYTDLNIDFKDKKQKHPIVGYLLEGTVKGGGPEVRLESISNDVYLRSKE
jgi:hypothetical protein